MLTDQDQTIVVQVITNDEGWQFTDNKNDPGGATKAGITQRSWEEYCKKKSFVPNSVEMLTKDNVIGFYDYMYYTPYQLATMPIEFRAPFFSALINLPAKEAVLCLQRVLYHGNTVWQDGQLGAKTLGDLQASVKTTKYGTVTNAFVDEWIRHYIQLCAQNTEAWVTYAHAKAPGLNAAMPPDFVRIRDLVGWFNRANKYRVYS